MRWYVTFKLSFRDLIQMLAERGITLCHTTILRWVQQYVPEFEKRWNYYARPVGDSWRVDETYATPRLAHLFERSSPKPFFKGSKVAELEETGSNLSPPAHWSTQSASSFPPRDAPGKQWP